MKRRTGEEEAIKTDRWLTTYSDMMNNLLVLFMALYAMSILDLEKFKALSQSLNMAFSNEEAVQTGGAAEASSSIVEEEESSLASAPEQSEEFDRVFAELQEKIDESGYQEEIILEQGDGYIRIRFGDTVLFYPDSPIMKAESYEILSTIGSILKSVNDLTESIEIDGHTADIGYDSNFFSWELSSNRAIAVLKFLVNTCELPESKMSVTGYSDNHPVSDNMTEESRSLNRRVEIRIRRIGDEETDEN